MKSAGHDAHKRGGHVADETTRDTNPMILAAFKEHHETTPEYPDTGRRGWRWVIETGEWQRGVYVSLEQQVIFHDPPHSAEWRPMGQYVTLALVRKFEFGEEHDYYDGPHCCVKLGWLRINYSWDWCKKCMPDQADDADEDHGETNANE